jgi:hypothetical protein
MFEYINIKSTNLVASRIALGTWAIGGWMCGGSDEEPGVGIALWGARRPAQLAPEVSGWSLTKIDFTAIDATLSESIRNPVGPELAPPAREKDRPVAIGVGKS